MSRGLASRDSHASHRSRAVDTGCLRMGARESRRLDSRPGSGGLLVARSLSAPVGAVGMLWLPPGGEECASALGCLAGTWGPLRLFPGPPRALLLLFLPSPTSSTGMRVLQAGVAGLIRRALPGGIHQGPEAARAARR